MSDLVHNDVIPGVLLYFLFPLWLAAGVADYLCHRRTRIEHTSGVGESALHVLQAAEIGVALVLGLFFEINALVLGIMIVAVIAHTFTALWDGYYTNRRRYISPLEQHIHSHLEYIPIVSVLLVVVLYWDVLRAAPNSSPVSPWALQWKRDPIPLQFVLVVLVPIVIGQGALLIEEFVRSRRAARS
jgi:hypothetical protein